MSGLADDIANLELFLSGYTCAEDCILADILDPDENLLTVGMLRRILAALTRPADHAGLVEALEALPNLNDDPYRTPEQDTFVINGKTLDRILTALRNPKP